MIGISEQQARAIRLTGSARMRIASFLLMVGSGSAYLLAGYLVLSIPGWGIDAVTVALIASAILLGSTMALSSMAANRYADELRNGSDDQAL